MAWLLVQLKLRLLKNALRSSTGAKVSFILSTTFACLVAIGLFIVLALFRGSSASVDLTTDHLHGARIRLDDLADLGVRPRWHSRPGHAGSLSAAHPPARRRIAGGLSYRCLAGG